MLRNWSPWHGCRRCSEGCENCYMFYMDSIRGKDGSDIYRTKQFSYPLSRDRQGRYKVMSGQMLSVCMNSDFFLEEADEWRDEAWDIIRIRSDVIFRLLTKRPERIRDCLPADWGEGWENVFLNITCENQRRADERLPILLELPFRHKAIHCAPLLGAVDIGKYLDSGCIEQVVCGGENYEGMRPCDFEWVRSLRDQCVERDITFCFMETGNVFIKDNRRYIIKNKHIQSAQALRSGMNYEGRKTGYELAYPDGSPVDEKDMYVPHYRSRCEDCSIRLICHGCSDCGRCK